jgi:hypothetical protein
MELAMILIILDMMELAMILIIRFWILKIMLLWLELPQKIKPCEMMEWAYE